MTHTNPKVLVFDIETSPILAYVWGLGEQRIALNQIKRDWYVLAWAAKWLGAPVSTIQYQDTRGRAWGDDKDVLKGMWKLLDEADIVVTQNGKKFDSRKLNARFMLHKMPPPSPYRHLDTYKIADSAAEFTSHKLEYLTDKLCTKYKKLSHKKFPGMALWDQCVEDNRKAWDEMKRYNIHDVLSTEELYTKIRPWAPQSAPSVYEDRGACRTCGKFELKKEGIHRTKLGHYQQWSCKNCNSWSKGDKIK